MRPTLLFALISALAACGTSPRNADDDPQDVSDGTDTIVDASDSDVSAADAADAGPDAELDTSSDLGAPPDVETDLGAPPDASVDLGQPGDTGADTGPIDAGVVPTEEFCAAACDDREGSNGGLCPLSEAPCLEACVELAPEEEQLVNAYFSCVESDPLCFQTILQCVLAFAFPEPFEHVVLVEGGGFEDHVGQRFYAAVQQNPDDFVLSDRLIDAPSFTQEIEVRMLANQSHLVLWYVDVDGDGECSRDTDVTGSASYDLWALDDAPIALPDWRIPVSPNPDIDAGFVCRSF